MIENIINGHGFAQASQNNSGSAPVLGCSSYRKSTNVKHVQNVLRVQKILADMEAYNTNNKFCDGGDKRYNNGTKVVGVKNNDESIEDRTHANHSEERGEFINSSLGGVIVDKNIETGESAHRKTNDPEMDPESETSIGGSDLDDIQSELDDIQSIASEGQRKDDLVSRTRSASGSPSAYESQRLETEWTEKYSQAI